MQNPFIALLFIESAVPISAAQLLAQRDIKLAKRKDLIAECSSRILEDPQENVCIILIE